MSNYYAIMCDRIGRMNCKIFKMYKIFHLQLCFMDIPLEGIWFPLEGIEMYFFHHLLKRHTFVSSLHPLIGGTFIFDFIYLYFGLMTSIPFYIIYFIFI